MTREEIKQAVIEALDDRLKEFYIDRETHYQDHLFIQVFRKWSTETKSAILKTIATGLIAILGGLLVLGFVMWGKKHF